MKKIRYTLEIESPTLQTLHAETLGELYSLFLGVFPNLPHYFETSHHLVAWWARRKREGIGCAVEFVRGCVLRDYKDREILRFRIEKDFL